MVDQVNTENIAPFGHLEESGHQIAGTPLTFPGVRGKVKENFMASDGSIILAGSTVIIQPLNRDVPNATPEFIITPYKRNKKTARANQPESQRDILPEKSHKATLAKPEDFLDFNEEHFQRSHAALFPSTDSPSLEEISQSRIPDCFLLAAIQAILSHPDGKSFIRGMMRQNEDGTTTVRLFDPVTLQLEYIRIENSVIVDGAGELNSHAALWVHILEKAFAARGKKNDTVVDASVSSVYTGGGNVAKAMRSLTGLITWTDQIKPEAYPWEIAAFLGKDACAMVHMLLELYAVNPMQITNYLSTLSTARLAVIYEYFGATVGNNESELQALNNYVELLKCQYQDPILYADAVKTRSSDKLSVKYPAAANILSEILSKTAQFSGYYSKNQLKVYTTIKDSFSEGKLVTTSTPDKFAKKVVGLVDRHAYTVLGVFEKQMHVKDQTGEIKSITARFVRLRNPWGDSAASTGKISRAYAQHRDDLEIQIQNSNEAIFHVELNDFCEYFEQHDISESANAAFQRDSEKEKYIANVNYFTNNFAINFTSSNSDLIEANAGYQQQLMQLCRLELMELKKLNSSSLEAINAIFTEKVDPAIERTRVTDLIDAKNFPGVSGSAEEVKEHIYALLKLNWLKAQSNQDKNLEAALMATIQRNATQPELWENLSHVKIILNTVMMVRVNAFHNDIDYMKELSDKLFTEMRELKKLFAANTRSDSRLIDTKIEVLINNFINLEQRYHQLLNLDLVVRNFGYTSNNDQYINSFAAVIKKCAARISPLIEAAPLLKDLWKLREKIRTNATDLKQKNELSAREFEQIDRATKNIFTGNMKSIGDKLLRDTKNESRHALGKDLIEADTLVNKIQRLIKRVGSFFSKVSARLSTFFQRKNSYELPPVEFTAGIENTIHSRRFRK